MFIIWQKQTHYFTKYTKLTGFGLRTAADVLNYTQNILHFEPKFVSKRKNKILMIENCEKSAPKRLKNLEHNKHHQIDNSFAKKDTINDAHASLKKRKDFYAKSDKEESKFLKSEKKTKSKEEKA